MSSEHGSALALCVCIAGSNSDAHGAEGAAEDGSWLGGADANRFPAFDLPEHIGKDRPRLHGGFDALVKKAPAMEAQTMNIVKQCPSCSKPNGISIPKCNACGECLENVRETQTRNLYIGMIFGVDQSTFPLKISLRSETPEIIVCDDPLALSRAHVVALPTNTYIPDIRTLFAHPQAGLAMVRRLDQAAWQALAIGPLSADAWRTKALSSEACSHDAEGLRRYVVRCFELPPSEYQLHLHYLLPPLLPRQYSLWKNGAHFVKYRHFPYQFVVDALQKLVETREALLSAPKLSPEDLVQAMCDRGVDYDLYYTVDMQQLAESNAQLANYDPEDFTYWVRDDTLLDRETQKRIPDGGPSVAEIAARDKFALQGYGRPYSGEGKPSGVFYSYARAPAALPVLADYDEQSRRSPAKRKKKKGCCSCLVGRRRRSTSSGGPPAREGSDNGSVHFDKRDFDYQGYRAEDGAWLAGADPHRFPAADMPHHIGSPQPAFTGGLDALRNECPPSMKTQLENTVKMCPKCEKPCAVDLQVCNGCGADLAGVPVATMPNLIVGMVYGVDKAPDPLRISLRLETPRTLVFDDPVAMTRAHMLAVPANIYVPDIRMLFAHPLAGMNIIERLDEAAWQALSHGPLGDAHWRGKALSPEGNAKSMEELRGMVVRGFSLPPSQSQIHLQYLLPPLMPSRYAGWRKGEHFVKGRHFPYSYVLEALQRLADEDDAITEAATMSPEQLVQILAVLGVDYDKAYTEDMRLLAESNALLANFDPDDFSYAVVGKKVCHLEGGHKVKNLSVQDVELADKLALQTYGRPYGAEHLPSGVYYGHARKPDSPLPLLVELAAAARTGRSFPMLPCSGASVSGSGSPREQGNDDSRAFCCFPFGRSEADVLPP